MLFIGNTLYVMWLTLDGKREFISHFGILSDCKIGMYITLTLLLIENIAEI